MQVVSTVKEVRDIVAGWRKEGKTVYYSLDDEHIETILGMAFDHTKEH